MSEGKHTPAIEGGQTSKIQREICPEIPATDAGCDYTLPDYLPEIRRVLSVRAEVLPAAHYESEGKVDVGGTVMHTLLYADGEGRLASLPLHADYTFSIGSEEDEIEKAVIDTSVEGTVCRLGGPRKVSLRTRLSSRAHLLGEESVAPEIRGMGSECDRDSIERLCERIESEKLRSVRSPEISLSGSFPLEGTGESTRAVWSGGGVLVNECRAERDAVSARGEVWVRVLCADGEGTPHTLRERIPFDTRVELAGVREGDGCVCHGRILSSDVSIAMGEGEERAYITVDLCIELEITAVGREISSPTTALYSTAYDMVSRYRDLTYHRPLGVSMGHYTVSGSRSRAECDAEEAHTVIDAHGRCEVGTVSADGGRAVVSGRVLCDLIFAEPPAGEGTVPVLLSATVECPFRIACDLHLDAGAAPVFVCHASLIGARGRLEEKTISVDCELALWVRAYEKRTMRILASAEPAGALAREEDGCVHVVYPQKGDSLFSLSARYHQKRAAVAAANNLPDAAMENAASPASLDGVHHLLIEE